MDEIISLLLHIYPLQLYKISFLGILENIFVRLFSIYYYFERGENSGGVNECLNYCEFLELLYFC